MPRTKPQRQILRLAQYGDHAAIEKLLKQATPEILSEALVLAAMPHHTIPHNPGHAKTVTLLLRAGANVDHCGGWSHETPLTAAARGGFADIITILQDAGAHHTIFHHAALGNLRPLRPALKKNPDLVHTADPAGLLLLHHVAASRMGDISATNAKNLAAVASLLLDHGADPNAVIHAEPTRRIQQTVPPLVLAAIADNLSVTEVLLARGADPNIRSSWGTPLMQACKYSPRIADQLLAHGANINAPLDDDRTTALHIMAHFPHPDAVAWLLAHGADPRLTTTNGQTPLHRAAERNTGPKVAQMLLDAGANPVAKDNAGRTPSAIAQRAGKTKVAAFLRAYLKPAAA